MKPGLFTIKFALILGWLALGSLSLGWPLAAPAQAQLPSLPVFTEDFSQGFSKWETLRESGAYWSITNGQAEAYITNHSTIAEMIPLDAYWNPTWTDLEYELDYTPLQGVDRNISFGFENLLNWYEIHFIENEYNLVRVMDGTAPFSISQPYQLQNGQTYRLKIRFDRGHIEVFINGTKIADHLDWSFNQNYGKIGIKAGTGASAPTRVRFDNIKVTLINHSPNLGVSLLKQTDPAWKAEEYDHGSRWSNNPTIERWGCAMTSMAMIMRYHGLTKFPDGREITPSTLNTWLKNQADGYVGEGAINWLAVTRLTRLISQTYGTPKLEYRRVEGSSLQTAQQEIADGKPVIMQIPGHFLVADGLVPNQNDLLIKDPAFTYTKMSQHPAPLSTRVFQPSQTDLSYWLLVSAKPLSVTVKNSNGAAVPIELTVDSITDNVAWQAGQPNPAQLPTTYQYLVPKPESGRYTLSLAQPQLGPYQVDVFEYDQTGEVRQSQLKGWVGSQPLQFEWQYRKDGSGGTQLTPLSSFARFRQDLQLVKQARLSTNTLWWLKLDRTAEFGVALQQPLNSPASQRYVSLLKSWWQTAAGSFKTPGRQYLEQQLKYLVR